MAATSTTSGRRRRLNEMRPEQGRVLSVYIDLDPSEFATGAARATQITSVCDEAERLAEQLDDLDHDESVALREDIHRLRNQDRKSTRLNSSHANISYAVFCLKKNNR